MVPHRARDECAADPDLGGPRRCVAEGPRDLVTRSTTHRRAPSSCRDALLPTIHALDKDQLTVSPAPAPVAGRTVQPGAARIPTPPADVPVVDSCGGGHIRAKRRQCSFRACPIYSASMTVHTAVAALPPMFRVAKRLAPWTW